MSFLPRCWQAICRKEIKYWGDNYGSHFQAMAKFYSAPVLGERGSSGTTKDKKDEPQREWDNKELLLWHIRP